MATCAIDPENTGILRTVGTLFLVAAVASLLSRKAYFRRVIDRDEEPGTYWQTIISYAFLGAFLILGSVVCPER